MAEVIDAFAYTVEELMQKFGMSRDAAMLARELAGDFEPDIIAIDDDGNEVLVYPPGIEPPSPD